MNILDVGSMFGMATSRIFTEWDHATVYQPHNLKEYEQLITNANLVSFGGGADIDPSLYGHQNVASNTGGVSVRDRMEQVMFRSALHHKVPMLGICRGAQLLCAMAGGALIQDINGHPTDRSGLHALTTVEGLKVPMTSMHHQAMYAEGINHELLAWVMKVPKSSEKFRLLTQLAYDHAKITPTEEFWKRDPEVVYFPDINALGIQGHPEFMSETSKAVDYTLQLVRQKLFKEKDLVITLKDGLADDSSWQ